MVEVACREAVELQIIIWIRKVRSLTLGSAAVMFVVSSITVSFSFGSERSPGLRMVLEIPV